MQGSCLNERHAGRFQNPSRVRPESETSRQEIQVIQGYDYKKLLDSLEENPFQGVSLGSGVYKVRMAISSKGKGKSGGARVLTYNLKKTEDERLFVTLMSVFDKGEMENVSDDYIKSVLHQAKSDE